jgi:hypothetical protein
MRQPNRLQTCSGDEIFAARDRSRRVQGSRLEAASIEPNWCNRLHCDLQYKSSIFLSSAQDFWFEAYLYLIQIVLSSCECLARVDFSPRFGRSNSPRASNAGSLPDESVPIWSARPAHMPVDLDSQGVRRNDSRVGYSPAQSNMSDSRHRGLNHFKLYLVLLLALDRQLDSPPS